MNIVEPLGAISLGIVIGWLVSYFVRRYEDFTPQTLGATVPLIVGGIIVKFLERSSSAIWFYPIGVLIGFALNIFLAYITGGSPEEIFYVEEVEEIEEDDTSIEKDN